MSSRPSAPIIVGAFAIALAAFGSFLLLVDATPLLVEPAPDFDWPIGLVGVMAGLWSASQINRLPFPNKTLITRIAVWIMCPVFAGFGFPAVIERVQEGWSFRAATTTSQATVPVVAKQRSGRKWGNVSYNATLISPFGHDEVGIPVDAATFATLVPERHCVTIAVERAPNGATRLLKALRWNVRCPTAGSSDRQTPPVLPARVAP